MVEPLRSSSSGGRPDCVVQRPVVKALTAGKHEEFKACLQRLSGRAEQPFLSSLSPESRPGETSPLPKEISRERELSGSLAPDEQPSLGGRSAEPAELFSLLNPLAGTESPPAAVPTPTTHLGVTEIEELLERFVRRMAVGGDQRRGAVRLDIGQGQFSGTELLVVAEAGQVSVEVQLPSSVAQAGLSERLRARLERRGYAAEVSVR